LSELEIIIELRRDPVEKEEIHGLQQLLLLYDLCVPTTTVKFEMQVDLVRARLRGSGPSKELQEQLKKLALKWMAYSRQHVSEFESGVEESELDTLRYVVASQTFSVSP
jgi:hypothetical protein